jgi:hypothetical protein
MVGYTGKDEKLPNQQVQDQNIPLFQKHLLSHVLKHNIPVDVGLGAISYAAEKGAKNLYSRPYKLFPNTNVIRPQPVRWGLQRFLGNTGKFLETKLFGKIPIVGPLIDLFTPSKTIMSGSEEMRLLREARARQAIRIPKIENIRSPKGKVIGFPPIEVTLPKNKSNNINNRNTNFGNKKFSFSPEIFNLSRQNANTSKDTWLKGINKSRPGVSIPNRPLKSVLKLGPHTPLDKKHRWVFPPKIVTATQPIFNPLKNLVPQKINFQPAFAPLKNMGQKNVQSRPILNPSKNMRQQGINIKPTNAHRGNIQQQSHNIARPVPFKPAPAFRPMPVFRPPPAFRPVPVFRPPVFRGRGR